MFVIVLVGVFVIVGVTDGVGVVVGLGVIKGVGLHKLLHCSCSAIVAATPEKVETLPC